MRRDWPGCRWSLLRWFHSRSCSGCTACFLAMVDKVSPLPTVYVAAMAAGTGLAVLAALAIAVVVGARDGADVALAGAVSGARASIVARMCARRALSSAASAAPSA